MPEYYSPISQPEEFSTKGKAVRVEKYGPIKNDLDLEEETPKAPSKQKFKKTIIEHFEPKSKEHLNPRNYRDVVSVNSLPPAGFKKEDKEKNSPYRSNRILKYHGNDDGALQVEDL